MINENKETLKSCPFCGGQARFVCKCNISHGDFRGWEFSISCIKCNATIPKTNYRLMVKLDENGNIVLVGEDERNKAIDAWNRRTHND
jgi:Lar family restriction alleviation protein